MAPVQNTLKICDAITNEQAGMHQSSTNPTNGKHRELKLMTINCCSLRSTCKQALFQVAIHQEALDIIFGTESHPDSTVKDGEVFPPTYDIYCKDRNSCGGGVFLVVDKSLVSSECNIDSNSESVWAKLQVKGSPAVILGAHYRPPDSNVAPISELNDSITKLSTESPNANIILGGDFNLPSISWEDNSISEKPQYGQEINTTFLDMVNDNGLMQKVNEPTHNDNILDLILTKNPDSVSNVKVVPGISDHSIVTASLSLDAQHNKKKPRKVWMFDKGNVDGLIGDMDKFRQEYLTTDYQRRSVQENWDMFKDAVNRALENNIPSKIIKGNNDLPWVKKRKVKRLMRRRKRAYNTKQRTKKEAHKKRYQWLRNLTKQAIQESHENYMMSILNLENCRKAPRKFWSYIRARGKDNVGVAPLKTADGLATTGSAKATALSSQYDSVFTDEDTSFIPDKGPSPHPTMDKIQFRTPGVAKLLRNLDVNKATGPDKIPIRVLKEAAEPIAPVLTTIMSQSYHLGVLPDDWHTANISAIFKKGDKSEAANYRPVSLTSVICKLMEHIIFKAIMDHNDSNSILSQFQHGFRSEHSCETQLINTMEDLSRAVDRGRQVDMLVLDFSKAFDKVPHKRLLYKLAWYGIQGHTLAWISS